MNNNQSIQNIYESQKKSLQRKIFNFLPRIFNFPLISCKKQIAKRKRRKKEHKIKYSKNTLHRFTYNTTTITTTITTTAFRQKKNLQPLFQFTTKSILDRRVEICSVSACTRFERISPPFCLSFQPWSACPRVCSPIPANIAILGADCIIRAGISAGNLVWQRVPTNRLGHCCSPFVIGCNAFDGAIILFRGSTFSGRLIGVLDGLMGVPLNYDDDCEIKVREICCRYGKNRTSTRRESR